VRRLCGNSGGLVISGPVYVELLAHPQATEVFVKEFLSDTGIVVEVELREVAWLEAARRFAKYAMRRRKGGESGPKRLLADFLIGSHALTQADRLMTLDPGRYRRDFSELRLV